MEAFQTLYTDLRNIKKEIPALAREAVKENKASIMRMLQREQLNIGMASDGGMLVGKRGEPQDDGHYKKRTQEYWAKRAPIPIKPKVQGTQYNFEWTGKTFRMMDVKISASEFEIFSRDAKFEMLKEFYGDIFNLTPENNNWINEKVILPFIHEALLKKLINLY